MMIVNKMVLRGMRLPVTLVMIQMAFTSLVICLFAGHTLHFGSRRDVRRWSCTVPWLFTAMLASSMLALNYATMGALVVLRNISPLLAILIEGMVTGERITFDAMSVVSLLAIAAGVILYVQHDISFSAVGMALMILNMVTAILERMLQRKMIAVEPIDVSKTGMMLINNSVALLPTAALLVWRREHEEWQALQSLDWRTWALVLGR